VKLTELPVVKLAKLVAMLAVLTEKPVDLLVEWPGTHSGRLVNSLLLEVQVWDFEDEALEAGLS